MTEITVDESIEIDRPAAEAWAVVADYGRDPEWRRGVVSMVADPAGPVRRGTATSEVLRMAGREWHNDGVVTSVGPGTRFTWRTTEGADALGARTVTALGPARCIVRLELVVRPHGAERLLRPLLARMLRRNVSGDLERLRALVAGVQAGADAPTAAGMR